MTGFLLDTNVPSELTRAEEWLEATDDEQLYLSVASLGENLEGPDHSSREQATGRTAEMDR